MAVSIGTDTDFTPTTAASSYTFSHTVASGTNCLVVRVFGWLNGTQANTVTYGGVSMTNVGRATASTGGDSAEVWRLLAPTAGAANVVVTMSGATQTTDVNAANLTGVDQTTPTGTFVSAVGSTGNPSVDVAAATDDLVVDAMGADGTPGGTNTVGSGQTAQMNTTHSGEFVACSSEAGAATVTMSWTRSTNSTWSIGGVAFKAPPTMLRVGTPTWAFPHPPVRTS